MPLLILFILDTFCLDNIRILLKALINSGISSDILEQAICITLSSLKDSNIKLINKIKAIVVRKEERLLEKKMKLTNLKPAPVVVDIISTLQKSSSEVFFNFSKILAPLNQLLNSKFTSCYQNFTLILNICDFLFAYVPNFQIDNSQSLLKLDESYDILDLASKFSDLIVEFSNTSKLLSQQHYLSALNHWSFICKLYFENYLDYNICEMDYLDKSFAMVFYIHFTFFDATLLIHKFEKIIESNFEKIISVAGLILNSSLTILCLLKFQPPKYPQNLIKLKYLLITLILKCTNHSLRLNLITLMNSMAV